MPQGVTREICRFSSFWYQCDRLAGGLQKIAEASEQLAILNEKLAVQKVAVTEKTAACEELLKVIASGTKRATEKKKLAEAKGKEIAESSKIIEVEKVCFYSYMGPCKDLPLYTDNGWTPLSSVLGRGLVRSC